jgi:hypothetical protein
MSYYHKKLSLGDTFALHMRHKRWYVTKEKDIIFKLEDMFRACGARERQGEKNNHCALALIAHGFDIASTEYNKVHNNITVVVELSRNPATEVRFHVSHQNTSSHKLAG